MLKIIKDGKQKENKDEEGIKKGGKRSEKEEERLTCLAGLLSVRYLTRIGTTPASTNLCFFGITAVEKRRRREKQKRIRKH